MRTDLTTDPAYETARDHVDMGQIAACIPVVINGQQAVFTTAGYVEPPKDDLDVLAQVFVAIRRARNQAEQAGAHPLP